MQSWSSSSDLDVDWHMSTSEKFVKQFAIFNSVAFLPQSWMVISKVLLFLLPKNPKLEMRTLRQSRVCEVLLLIVDGSVRVCEVLLLIVVGMMERCWSSKWLLTKPKEESEEWQKIEKKKFTLKNTLWITSTNKPHKWTITIHHYSIKKTSIK